MIEQSPESPLSELLELLKLEQLEDGLFRGRSQDVGFGALFGGQVLGQALYAAARTVPMDRRVHSLHAYFLRPGDTALPVLYEVETIREGTSFSTRRVRAVQKGTEILSLTASFHVREAGFEHQGEAPAVQGPEGLPTELDLLRSMADRLPPESRERLLCARPIEIRSLDPANAFAPEKRLPFHNRWFRAAGRVPDDPLAHECLLAYASDFHLVAVPLYPHGRPVWGSDVQLASLDHALWFHRDFRIDEWLLYALESPSASGGRGLTVGRVFSQRGELVASVAQEALVRRRRS